MSSGKGARRARRKAIRNLFIFISVVLTSGWIGWRLDVLTGSPHSEGPGILLWIISPLAASLLLRLFAGDGWSDMGLKPNLKGNVKWYIFAVAVFPFSTVVILILGNLTGAISFSNSLPRILVSVLKVFFMGFPALFIKNIFEEAAWRGYLAPKIYSAGLADANGHVAVGLIWAAWHIPYYLFFLDKSVLARFTTLNTATFILLSFVIMISWALVYGEILLLTKSLWPAIIMHTVEDALLIQLITDNHIRILPGTDWLISPMNGLMCALIFSVFGLLLRRMRRNLQMGQTAAEES